MKKFLLVTINESSKFMYDISSLNKEQIEEIHNNFEDYHVNEVRFETFEYKNITSVKDIVEDILSNT